MNGQRSFYDADRTESFGEPTVFQNDLNQNEVYCSVCGEMFFTDDLSFEKITRTVENTLENPFVCEDCRSEYEEMEHTF